MTNIDMARLILLRQVYPLVVPDTAKQSPLGGSSVIMITFSNHFNETVEVTGCHDLDRIYAFSCPKQLINRS